MKRYDLGPPPDDEFEPNSEPGVLRNRLGLKRSFDVELAESQLLKLAQEKSYFQISPETRITVHLIQELHESWLGPLYEFAGKIRTVDLAKDTVRFAPAVYLPGSLAALDKVLEEHTPCSGMDLDRLVYAISATHAELVLVHPFREGNGRVSRWVADLMALQANYLPLNWKFNLNTQERQAKYFAALRRGFAMDFSALQALVREALESALPSTQDPLAEE